MPSDDTSASLPRPPLEDLVFDAFGRDAGFIERARPWLEKLLDRWFLLEASGLEHIPPSGRAILVCNHGGALPWDAVVLIGAMVRANARPVRPLLEDAVMTAPFLGTWMTRLGAVRASQENAVRLLEREELVAAFPEGLLGLSKLWRHRYKLTRFGRGGFVRLALRTGAPLLPVAMLGGEDAAPLVAKVGFLFRGTHVDYLPVTPLFPALGPLGLLAPLPARWGLKVGEPIDARTLVPDPDDAVAVNAVAAQIRDRIQADLDEMAAARSSVYHVPV